MGKTALVVGGTGFLGMAIAGQLTSEGWHVTLLARGEKRISGDWTVLRADRTVAGELDAQMAGRYFDLIVDCAAYQERDAVGSIAGFTGKCGHYVFISTDYVYASGSKTAYPLSERSPTQRDTSYAAGKLDCERLLLEAWSAKRFPVTVLRPPHIVGAGKEAGCDQALGRDPALLDMIRLGQGLKLIAEGQLLIQPVWNREIGRCIAHVAGMEKSFGHIFQCTGPDAVTAKRYYEIIAEHLGVPLQFESVPLAEFIRLRPDHFHHARHRIYDTSHLTRTTGYEPHLKLEDALRETVEWMQHRTGA